MRKSLLISASAIALIAGGNLAIAQSMNREAPSPAPKAQQSAPAEKMAPGTNGAREQQRAPDSGTTGQGAPSRMEQERPQGTQAPAGRQDRQGQDRQGQDQQRLKSGDPKPPGRDTTGQGAAGSAGAANLTSEQRTRISTTIKQTNVRPVTNVNFNVSVGTVVPRTIELHPLPPTIVEVYPAWRGYRFVLVGDEIIIIEPGSYRIVAVIDA